ncbi:MAG: hypothetical protein WA996_00355 [Candidatus Promineifilaceae bacterium]
MTVTEFVSVTTVSCNITRAINNTIDPNIQIRALIPADAVSRRGQGPY